MPTHSEIEALLSDLARSDDWGFDAARAGLYLAALDNPEVELARYESHLKDLASSAAARQQEPPAEALAHVMTSLYGYRGDRHTYDDMKNADLITVIDRRRGLPVALGLLYMSAAAGLQSKLVGLAFPGHFLMRIENGPERVVVDPFNDGKTCSPGTLRSLVKRVLGAKAELEPAYFEPVSPRAVVIRLLMNIRIRALKAGRKERAIEIVRRMTLIAPRDARLWADLAELHVSSGNLTAAKAAFERSIDGAPNENFRIAAEAALQSVNRKLN